MTLSGTAGATSAIVTGNGTTYNVAMSGMTSDGTVIASIAAGVAHDAAGNASVASTSTDNVVTLSTPTHTWGGGSTENNLWTTKENWVGNVAPLPGDNLIFPAGAAQLVNFNDYTSGTTFGSITVSGDGYHFQGNAYQSSTFVVQANINVEVNSIYGDTLTMSPGSMLNITPIPSGALGASRIHPTRKSLSTDNTLPVISVNADQATVTIADAQPVSTTTDISQGPVAASTVVSTPPSEYSEAASAAASSGSLSNTVFESVAMPNVIIADTVLPVHLAETTPARLIDTAINRVPSQSPMYFRLDSSALPWTIENWLENPRAEKSMINSTNSMLTSLQKHYLHTRA